MLGGSVLSKIAEASAPTELNIVQTIAIGICLSVDILPHMSSPCSLLCQLCTIPALKPGIYLYWSQLLFPAFASVPCHFPWQWRADFPSFDTSSKPLFCPGTTYLLGTVPRAHNIVKDSQKCFNFF